MLAPWLTAAGWTAVVVVITALSADRWLTARHAGLAAGLTGTMGSRTGELGRCPEQDAARDPLDKIDGDAIYHPLAAEPIVGVATTAYRHGMLAAWTERRVYLSSDDGRSFAPVLDRFRSHIRQVVIDCHGRVFVLRYGGHLDVHHHGRESWHYVDLVAGWGDDGDGVKLAANGGVVALAGYRRWETALAVSIDGGASWRVIDRGRSGTVRDLQIDGNGIVRSVASWDDSPNPGLAIRVFDPTSGTTTIRQAGAGLVDRVLTRNDR